MDNSKVSFIHLPSYLLPISFLSPFYLLATSVIFYVEKKNPPVREGLEEGKSGFT